MSSPQLVPASTANGSLVTNNNTQWWRLRIHMTFPRKMFSINNKDTANTAVVTVALTASSKSFPSSVCFSCVVVVVVDVVVIVVVVDVPPPQWSVTERVFADFQCAPSAAAVAAAATACSELSC